MTIDLDDPRLDDYRSLKDRDVARRRGAFVAEGAEVVERLIRSPWSVRSVLIAQERLKRMAPVLGELDPGVPVLVLSLDRMRALVGFDIHRGVLAAGVRDSGPSVDAVLEGVRGSPRAVLGLVGLANTDNVGACFRHAAALGAGAVFIDRSCADPLYRRSLRVSMGHALGVPFADLGSTEALMTRLAAEDIAAIGLTPSRTGVDVDELLSGRIRPPRRFALLVGSEGPGLASEILSRTQFNLRIPMAEGVDSLNAAAAAAVALFALRYASPESFSS